MTIANDNRSLWASVVSILEKYDALLDVLGQVYTDIYLAQWNRPDGAGYFDYIVQGRVYGLEHIQVLERGIALFPVDHE